MTTLATETWTGTNGAAWPAQWTRSGDTGHASTIQGNKGRLTTGTGTYATTVQTVSGMTATSDTDVTVSVWPQTAGIGQWAFVRIKGTGLGGVSWVPSSGYQFWIYTTGAGESVLSLKRYNSDGTEGAFFDGISGPSWSTTSGLTLRLQYTGTTLRYKIWTTGGAEPGSWAGTYTDSGVPNGKVALLTTTDGSAVRSVEWDDLTVTDGNTAPFVTANVDVSGSGTLSLTATPKLAVSASLSASGTLSGTSTPLASASVSLTGSGTLTATTVHVVAAALSGSGTLVADFGARNVNAGLSGSGTLTAAVPAISVSPNLTATGTLTATIVVPAYAVALTGSGQLDAAVTPRLTVAAALTAEGRLAATYDPKLFAWVFRTPTQEVWYRIAGRGLVGKYDQGLTVYRVGGQWRTRFSPGPDDLAPADRAYQGGHLHRLSDAERADLVAGGFSDSITYEEVTA